MRRPQTNLGLYDLDDIPFIRNVVLDHLWADFDDLQTVELLQALAERKIM